MSAQKLQQKFNYRFFLCWFYARWFWNNNEKRFFTCRLLFRCGTMYEKCVQRLYASSMILFSEMVHRNSIMNAFFEWHFFITINKPANWSVSALHAQFFKQFFSFINRAHEYACDWRANCLCSFLINSEFIYHAFTLCTRIILISIFIHQI